MELTPLEQLIADRTERERQLKLELIRVNRDDPANEEKLSQIHDDLERVRGELAEYERRRGGAGS